MYTLGAVAIARVAIEQDRSYSLGYAVVLGLVAFIAMLRFLDSTLFIIFILAMIGYLSDTIVRDCTLIDEDADSSDQGLIDAGKRYLQEQRDHGYQQANPQSSVNEQSTSETHLSDPTPSTKNHRGAQPGRTVLYLAFAALPLFGIGQLFLRDDTATWQRAQRLLAFYLFSSLSLLVTTSFLGLRRYLRQRNTEMPRDVTVSWITGGLLLIGIILFIAFAIPIPGNKLANFDTEFRIGTPDWLKSSEFGWGKEGTESTSPDSSRITQEDETNRNASTVSQRDAEVGQTAEGQKNSGPRGQQSGKQQSGKQPPGTERSSNEQSSRQKPNQNDRTHNQTSQTHPSDSRDPETNRSPRSKENQPNAAEKSSGNSQGNNDSENQRTNTQGKQTDDPSTQNPEQPQQNSEQSQQNEKKNRNNENAQSNPSEPSDTETDPASKQTSGQNDRSPQESTNDQQQQQQQPSQSSSALSLIGNLLGGLIKVLIYAALVGILGFYLWQHKDELRKLWDQWFGIRDDKDADAIHETEPEQQSTPPRSFHSFRNPFEQGVSDSKTIVITFQAFEAWSRERGFNRERDETPSEFLRRLTEHEPQIKSAASSIVQAYQRVVYGRLKATHDDLDGAKAMWKIMSSAEMNR